MDSSVSDRWHLENINIWLPLITCHSLCSNEPNMGVKRIFLHSTAPPNQAEAAMRIKDLLIRKIILATNIVESSITIPGVEYGRSICIIYCRFAAGFGRAVPTHC